jgi:GNAT superfamily N-acetyltransferase
MSAGCRVVGDNLRGTFPAAPAGRQLECGPWSGAWSEVAHIVRLAWSENPDFEYSAAFLAECSQGREEREAVTFGAWLDGRLVGFVAALPRRIVSDGREQWFALVTFFAVHPDTRGRGIGQTLWTQCLRALREAGFDGTIHYCAHGHRSNNVTTSAAAQIGFACARTDDVGFLRRPIDVKMALPVPMNPASDVFAKAASDARAAAPVSRAWTAGTIEHHLNGRRDVVAVTSVEGSDCGALVGQVRTLADPNRTRCLVVEDVLWAHLEPDARERLARRFIDAARTRAAMAIVPRLGYADLDAFVRCGFRASGRVVHLYLTQLSARAPVRESRPVYMDVL